MDSWTQRRAHSLRIRAPARKRTRRPARDPRDFALGDSCVVPVEGLAGVVERCQAAHADNFHVSVRDVLREVVPSGRLDEEEALRPPAVAAPGVLADEPGAAVALLNADRARLEIADDREGMSAFGIACVLLNHLDGERAGAVLELAADRDSDLNHAGRPEVLDRRLV